MRLVQIHTPTAVHVFYMICPLSKALDYVCVTDKAKHNLASQVKQKVKRSQKSMQPEELMALVIARRGEVCRLTAPCFYKTETHTDMRDEHFGPTTDRAALPVLHGESGGV